MKKHIFALFAVILITSTISYGYEIILDKIINKTPHKILFTGKDVAFPMAVPTVPSQPVPTIKAGSKPLSYPIAIPAHSQKIIRKQIVNNEESKSGAEIFFNFKDIKNHMVSIINRSGQIFKFAPLLGWKPDTINFNDPNGSYHVSFVFEGKDGITNAKIKYTQTLRKRAPAHR